MSDIDSHKGVSLGMRYFGHGRGIVVTNDGKGSFSERPMTIAERHARLPAAIIQDEIHRLANQAGVCYHEIWSLIAAACQDAIDAFSTQRDLSDKNNDQIGGNECSTL